MGTGLRPHGGGTGKTVEKLSTGPRHERTCTASALPIRSTFGDGKRQDPTVRSRPQVNRLSAISVDISPGELLDKLSILQIKLERIYDPQKLADALFEHDRLSGTFSQAVELMHTWSFSSP